MNGSTHAWLSRLVLIPLAASGVTALADTAVAADGRGWTARPSLITARAGADVATVDGRIVVVGGFGPDLNDPTVFDSAESRGAAGNGVWRTVTPMRHARANPAVAALDGSVYAAGGFDLDGFVDSVERFDQRIGTWSESPTLPVPRGSAGGAALGGRFYVAGGLIPGLPEDEITDSVVAFDPVTQRWVSVASMNIARRFTRLVSAGGRLYAIGGLGRDGRTLSSVERYDPALNRWQLMASMSTDRGNPGVVAVSRGRKQQIVVVGGARLVNFDGVEDLRSTEVYDLDTGCWTVLPDLLPRGRATLVAAAQADGSILAIGGAVEAGGVETATAEVHALRI
jgi:N-acetylneuraminic acid mutarotase